MTGTVLVGCAIGTVLVDLEDETAELSDELLPDRPSVETGLPLVVDADRCAGRIVCAVGRRPPVIVSDDAGVTWREAGGGLPSGRAVAISPDHPDHIVLATAERLHVSTDGGRFWRALAIELPEITAVRWPSGE